MSGIPRRRFLVMSAASAASIPLLAGVPTAFAAPAAKGAAKKTVRSILDQIPAKVREQMALWKVPGMEVGVVAGDELIYNECFGVTSLATGRPYTPKSVQGLQSSCSALVGVAIVQLMEAGKLSADDTLKRYVPYFDLADPRHSQITIRQALGHTPGLPWLNPAEDALGGHPAGQFADIPGDPDTETYIRCLKSAGVSLLFDPGTSNSYSDLAYDILGEVVRNISGQRFEEYCEEHFFEPLGMKDSTLLLGEVDPKRLVTAHVADANVNPVVMARPPWVRRHIPSNGLHSTVLDTSRWLRMLMNHGRLGTARILQPASVAGMWTTLGPWNPDPNATAGWGFVLSTQDGHMTVANYGDGFIESSLMMAPDRGIAVIAFCNVDPYPADFPTWEVGYWLLGSLLATA